jgi:hypothetical protein
MRTRTFLFASSVPWLVVFGCATAENNGGALGGKHDASLDEGFDVLAPPDDVTPTTDSGVHPSDTGHGGTDTGHGGTDTGHGGIDTGTPPPFDTGTTGTDTGTIGTDTGGGLEGGPSQGGTTGTLCSTSTDCDVLHDGVQGCTSDSFTSGTLYPTPVCIGRSCTPDPTGASIVFCDGTLGVCLPVTSGGICLPACTFSSTSSPTGCRGKDACDVYGWTTSTTDPTGYGYCFGGCAADSDCIAGGVCQTETGLCVTSKVTYTKSLGTACTSTDATSTPAACNCLYSTTTNKGYCTQYCIFGGTPSCSSGYTCDTLLPSSGTTIFSGSPSGLAGSCLKNCTTDADCTAINSTCKQSAGVSSKTCQPF